MHLVLCVDERDGLSFCGRRLSRDSKVISCIRELTAGCSLWMSPYSANLFDHTDVKVDENFQKLAGDGDYCFLETTPLLTHYDNLESVILFCWNRSYPSTVRFPRALLDGMKLADTRDFPGSSHERITMERYIL